MTVQTVEWSGGAFTSPAVRDYISSLAQAINDGGLSDSSTWSSQRIDSHVRELVAALDPGSFDVQEIGVRPAAKGDGTTDDTQAIQNALTAAASNPKQRTVVLDAGKTYMVRELLVPADVTLNGRGAWIKNIAGTAGSPVTLNGDRAVVVDVKVDGQADKETSQRVAGIGVRAFRDCRIDSCYVRNTGWHGIVAVDPKALIVSGCVVEDTGLWQLPGSSQKIGYGICLTSASASSYSQDCLLYGNTVRRSDDGGIGFDGHGRNNIIANNTVRDNGGDGVTGYSHRHEGMVVIGNSFENTGNSGIHIAGRDLVVVGNRSLRATTTAISIATRIPEVPDGEDPNSYNVTITGNVITDCGMYGIRAERTIGGTITGNTVKGAGRGAGASYPGPYPTMQLSSSESFAVSGNYLDGLGVASRGIDMPSCTGVTITGNVIQNVGTGIVGNPYTNAGTSTAISVIGNMLKNMSTGVQSVGTSTGWDVAHNVYQDVATRNALAGTNRVGAEITHPTDSARLDVASDGTLTLTVGGTQRWQVAPSSSGPTTQPPTSLDWGSVTGTPAAYPPEEHGHAIEDVDGLRAALDAAASAAGAPAVHTHEIEDVDGLQATIDRLTYDSGWRDVSSLLPAGLAKSTSNGRCNIKRKGDRLLVDMHLTVSAPGVTRIFTLPTAWRPDVPTLIPYILWTVGAANHGFPPTMAPGYLGAGGAMFATADALPNPGTIQFYADLVISRPLPTTLPGDPA